MLSENIISTKSYACGSGLRVKNVDLMPGFHIIARSLEIVYGRSGRLYGNSNGKLRGDRDRPDRTPLYPTDRDDRVNFMCDHMETSPGDSSDWKDRNVSQYVLFRDQNSLFSLTLSEWRWAAIISTPPCLWQKSKNMNVYTINFARITKISSYG